MLSRRSFSLWVALSASVVSQIFAQTAASPDSESSVATFHVNARSVVVDVVVTDKSGKAVTGIPRQNFQVFEDGKPQPITFFEEHAGVATTAKPIEPPPLPPNTFTNVPRALPADSVNVLLMDALNTPMDDQAYAHKQMIKYLATIPPGTRIAVFLLSDRLRIVQGFTEDSSVLLAAIAHSAANPERSALLHDPAEESQMAPVISAVQEISAIQDFQNQLKTSERNQRVDMTLDALRAIAGYLAGLPGRKNLIWFTSSIPLCMFAKDTVDCPYYDRIKSTINTLNNAQVSLYPIEAGGLLSNSTFDSESLRPAAPGVPLNRAVSYALEQEANDRNSNHLAMDQLARNTGGKATYNQNGLKEALEEDIDNGARYYTVAYTPTNLRDEGRERKIEVKLASGKYNLAYRRGYTEDTPSEARAAETAKVKDPLRPLMDRGMPNFTELRYQTRIVPVHPQPAADVARAGDNSALKAPFTRYGVDFTLATDGLELARGPDGVRRGKIEVAEVPYSRDGKPLNWMVHFVGLVIRPDQYATAQNSGIPFHLEIDVPPGEVYLRTGIFDTSSHKAGTLEIPLNALSAAGK
jgi:VWFA-related protein